MNIKTKMVGKDVDLQVYSCSSFGKGRVVAEFEESGIEYVVLRIYKWGGSKEMRDYDFFQVLQVVQQEEATRFESLGIPEIQKDVFSPSDRKDGIELFDFDIRSER